MLPVPEIEKVLVEQPEALIKMVDKLSTLCYTPLKEQKRPGFYESGDKLNND